MQFLKLIFGFFIRTRVLLNQFRILITVVTGLSWLLLKLKNHLANQHGEGEEEVNEDQGEIIDVEYTVVNDRENDTGQLYNETKKKNE
jgi:hypothetical protein